MAKFNEREGNSCHIHLSLRGKDGAPVFAEQPELFDRFLAGQLACLRELTLFLAPNINSYKRFAEGSFAPTAVAWGRDNRTCSLRVVGHGPAKRVESRLPGGDVNPYLAIAAMIAAGLHGIDNGARARDPRRGQRVHGRQAARAEHAAEARDLFADSAVAREAFGEEVVAHYLNNADVELRAFEAAVTDWERVPRLRAAVSSRHATDPVFAPVHSQTAFEETLERLGTAIKLGLLEPGRAAAGRARAVRQLGISRSTLRQALTALVQSGHLHAVRGRRGGTFVADHPPPAAAPVARAARRLARRLRPAARHRARRRGARLRARRAGRC